MWPEEIEIASFNEYGSTEELIAAHEKADEEWFQVDEYRLAGKMLRLYKSDWGRYQVVRDWIEGPRRSFVFGDSVRAIEVFDANQRLMDKKWFADEPPPPGWGKF